MRRSHEAYIRSALEQGNCEYLKSQNGGLLAVINEFSYVEEMFAQVVETVYEDDELSQSNSLKALKSLRKRCRSGPGSQSSIDNWLVSFSVWAIDFVLFDKAVG